MGVKGMWTTNATILVVLIVMNMMGAMLGDGLWIALGIVFLLGAMFLSFKQGTGIGHGACGVRATVERARSEGEGVYGQLDDAYLSQAWSRATGAKALLASALIPYAVGCVYIILTLVDAGRAVIFARVAAWVVSLPYWPVIKHWHQDFVTLTPAIVAMLMITPFILPGCTFLGYLQGPKLWDRTEAAMKEGRRRAKANARVGKKLAPRQQKPEI